jgi:hypothetical protein
MKVVLFLDLDDTIFQTRPKCPPGAALRPAAFRRDGTPLSFMTDRQSVLLERLVQAARVIPTTARSFEAYRRVQLGLGNMAILDFGGVVLLDDGKLDTDWDAAIRPAAQASGPELVAQRVAVERFIKDEGLGAYARVIVDYDMPLYLVVKHPEGDHGKLQPIRAFLTGSADPERFFLHANDNNLSLVPRFLGKERAVRHVLEHRLGPGPVLTIGMGDSLSDAPFLGLCDYTLLPRDCQLARHRLHERPNA